MEEDIQKYLPTVMFRGTPCIIYWNRIERYKCFPIHFYVSKRILNFDDYIFV